MPATNSSVTLGLTCDDGSGSGCGNVKFSSDSMHWSSPQALATSPASAQYSLRSGEGALLTWGYNSTGQLGNGTFDTTAHSTPAQVGTSGTNISENFESGNLSLLPWTTGGNGNWAVTTSPVHGGSYAAKAAAMVDNQSSYLQVIKDCPAGTISFWYSVSSEQDYDVLMFYIDGVQQGAWSGLVPWTQATFPISAGSHTFKWQYSKDGSKSVGFSAHEMMMFIGSSGPKWAILAAGPTNAAAVSTDGDLWMWGDNSSGQLATGGTDAIAHPTPVQVTSGTRLSDNFESGNLNILPWTTSGNVSWAVTNSSMHGGSYAVQAPVNDGRPEARALQLTQNCPSRHHQFLVLTSDSEQNYDYLKFYIDGVQQGAWSGTVAWTQASFPVTAGPA